MFKPPELFIGLRYMRSQRRSQFISFISLASLVGITLGVITLITILSVMNGFEAELRNRILGMVAHVTITGENHKLKDWNNVSQLLNGNKQVTGSAPFIEKQVMVSSDSGVHGVLIQGIDPDVQNHVSDINDKFLDGNFSQLTDRSYNIAIGIELATTLNVAPGDKITVISPQAQVTPAGLLPRMKRFTVQAIYQVGLPEYDSASAFINLQDAQRLFRMRDQVSGVRLKLDELFNAPKVSSALKKANNDSYTIIDWTEENGSLYDAARTEKIIMFLLMVLIIFIAVTNLVSSLEMMVNDKRADIAILRTMGMSSKGIARIFMFQGSLVGIIGTLVGAVLGVLLALNVENIIPAIETMMGRKIFPPDVFYISDIPSDLQWPDVWIVTITALLISIIATRGPAMRAAKIQPAEALRYE